MSYNQEFFGEYKFYLQEPTVRKAHDTMFRIFDDVFPKWKYPFNVVDFGCGQCCEYLEYGKYSTYSGLDLNPPARIGTHKTDYTKLDGKGIKWFSPSNFYAFVSLFSTECCMNTLDRYNFYRMLFRETDVEMGLVSGFYYKNRIKEKKVTETGGIVSYQTIEAQQDYICPEFIEYRTYINLPSKMFGPDVVEVWKTLIRKHD